MLHDASAPDIEELVTEREVVTNERVLHPQQGLLQLLARLGLAILGVERTEHQLPRPPGGMLDARHERIVMELLSNTCTQSYSLANVQRFVFRFVHAEEDVDAWDVWDVIEINRVDAVLGRRGDERKRRVPL